MIAELNLNPKMVVVNTKNNEQKEIFWNDFLLEMTSEDEFTNLDLYIDNIKCKCEYGWDEDYQAIYIRLSINESIIVSGWNKNTLIEWPKTKTWNE